MAFVFPDAGKALKAKALFEKKGNKYGKPELLELVLNHNHIAVETIHNVLLFNILYGNQYDDVWRQVRNDIVLHCQSDGKNVENQFFSKKCCDTLSNVYSNSQSSDHCVSIELSTVPNENSLYITYTNNTDSSVYFLRFGAKEFDFPQFAIVATYDFRSKRIYGLEDIPDCSGEHYYLAIGNASYYIYTDTNFLSVEPKVYEEPFVNYMVMRYYVSLRDECRKEKYYNYIPRRDPGFLKKKLSEEDVITTYSDLLTFLRPGEKYTDCFDMLALAKTNAAFDIYFFNSYRVHDDYTIESGIPIATHKNPYLPSMVGEYHYFVGPFISNSTKFPAQENTTH